MFDCVLNMHLAPEEINLLPRKNHYQEKYFQPYCKSGYQPSPGKPQPAIFSVLPGTPKPQKFFQVDKNPCKFQYG